MITDEELIKQYLAGDEEALKTLIKRNLKPVYNFVYRYTGNGADAQDITQETFVLAWKNLKKFDQTRKFKTWVFTIAKNTALNWLKKKKPLAFSQFLNSEGENVLEQTLVDPAPLADRLFDRKLRAGALALAVQELNPSYRQTLALYYDQNLNFREIAQILGDSIDTVKSRHRRAILALKKRKFEF